MFLYDLFLCGYCNSPHFCLTTCNAIIFIMIYFNSLLKKFVKFLTFPNWSLTEFLYQIQSIQKFMIKSQLISIYVRGLAQAQSCYSNEMHENCIQNKTLLFYILCWTSRKCLSVSDKSNRNIQRLEMTLTPSPAPVEQTSFGRNVNLV